MKSFSRSFFGHPFLITLVTLTLTACVIPAGKNSDGVSGSDPAESEGLGSLSDDTESGSELLPDPDLGETEEPSPVEVGDTVRDIPPDTGELPPGEELSPGENIAVMYSSEILVGEIRYEFKSELDTKKEELESLKMTRELLTRKMLSYAGTDREDEVRQEISEVDRQIELMEWTIQNLEEDLSVEQLGDMIASLRAQLKSLQDQGNTIRVARRTLIDSGRDTPEQLSEMDNQLAGIQQNISQTQDELNHYQGLWEKKITLSEIDDLIADLNERLANLQGQEDMQRRAISNLVEHGGTEEQISEAQSDLDQIQDDIGSVQDEIAALEALKTRKS